MNRVLVLSGTCGSGKSTIARLLSDEHGWTRLGEDDVWRVGVGWELRVLHPRLEVAIERDATREGWSAGAAGVEELWRKFSGRTFGAAAFIDTSDDLPRASVRKVLATLDV